MLLTLLNSYIRYCISNVLNPFEVLRTQTLGSVLPSIACGNVVDMLLESVRKAELYL